MPSTPVVNPSGAFGYADAANQHPRIEFPFYNGGSADIAEGDVVTLDATITASQRLHVKQSDADADSDQLVIGVAAEAIPAGKTGNVVVFGYAVVNVGDSSSITAGQFAALHASTDGAAANIGATVVGEFFGVFLGAEDLLGTNKAPVWIDSRRLGTAA